MDPSYHNYYGHQSAAGPPSNRAPASSFPSQDCHDAPAPSTFGSYDHQPQGPNDAPAPSQFLQTGPAYNYPYTNAVYQSPYRLPPSQQPSQPAAANHRISTAAPYFPVQRPPNAGKRMTEPLKIDPVLILGWRPPLDHPQGAPPPPIDRDTAIAAARLHAALNAPTPHAQQHGAHDPAARHAPTSNNTTAHGSNYSPAPQYTAPFQSTPPPHHHPHHHYTGPHNPLLQPPIIPTYDSPYYDHNTPRTAPEANTMTYTHPAARSHTHSRFSTENDPLLAQQMERLAAEGAIYGPLTIAERERAGLSAEQATWLSPSQCLFARRWPDIVKAGRAGFSECWKLSNEEQLILGELTRMGILL